MIIRTYSSTIEFCPSIIRGLKFFLIGGFYDERVITGVRQGFIADHIKRVKT